MGAVVVLVWLADDVRMRSGDRRHARAGYAVRRSSRSGLLMMRLAPLIWIH
jgi:hypothetical protein